MHEWLRGMIRRGRLRTVLLAVAAILVAGGLAAIVTAVAAQRTPPQPAPAMAESITTPSPPPQRRPSGLSASRPTDINIPAIDVHTPLLALGQNPDGSLQVPAMGPNYNKAAWYKYSPSPGQIGPTVIEGHVDSAKEGPSVFYRLGGLHRGDKVTVTRADHVATEFTVDKIARYPKDHFPTETVYGGTDDPQLRLITCGGSFDRSKHSYTDNIVVYGHLVTIRRP